MLHDLYPKQLLTGLTLLLILSNLSIGIAQDPEFTQFYSNPVYLNPAFAGSAKSARVGINFRNQWAGIDHPFRTFSASYDGYVKSITGGLGIQFVNDGAGSGTYHSNSIAGVYAYHMALDRKYNLSAGAKAGYTEKSINWDEMTFGDMIDPDQGFVFESREVQPLKSRGYLDLSAGVLIYNKDLFAGFAVHHLHEPITSLVGENKLDRRYSFHAGMHLKMGNTLDGEYTVSPNIMYTQQGEFDQLNMGLYFRSGVVTAGVWYRTTDAIILLFGVKTTRFRIGYSYDMTISRLTMSSGGAHELSFVVLIPSKTPRMNYDQLPCAEF